MITSPNADGGLGLKQSVQERIYFFFANRLTWLHDLHAREIGIDYRPSCSLGVCTFDIRTCYVLAT